MNTNEHILTCLAEEGAEVALELIKLTHKAHRFGLEDRNVLNPTGPTNRERLIDELNDLMGVIEMCVDHGILPADWKKRNKIEAKIKKVMKFMDYAESKGALKG